MCSRQLLNINVKYDTMCLYRGKGFHLHMQIYVVLICFVVALIETSFTVSYSDFQFIQYNLIIIDLDIIYLS